MLKLALDSGRWYSLTRLDTGRRLHACAKITLNNRPGLVVSGGVSRGKTNVTSVEFYDTSSGQWVSLPSLNIARRGHAMMVENGRLVVVGGMTGQNTYLQDMEIFNGDRYVSTI